MEEKRKETRIKLDGVLYEIENKKRIVRLRLIPEGEHDKDAVLEIIGVARSTIWREVVAAYGKEGAKALPNKDVGYIENMVEKIPMLKKLYDRSLGIAKFNITGTSGFGLGGLQTTIARTQIDFMVYFYDEAFTSNLLLAAVIGHELVHVHDYFSGAFNSYRAAFGKHDGIEALFATYVSEVNAWMWTNEMAYDIQTDASYEVNDYYKEAVSVWNGISSNLGKPMPYIYSLDILVNPFWDR